MARPTRLDIEGGWYQVINRGALGAALYLARNYSDKTLRELGQSAGGMQYSALTMVVRRFFKRLETDEALTKEVKRLTRMLLVKT